MSQTTDQARGRSGIGSARRKTRSSAHASRRSSPRASVPSPPKRRRPALTALAVLLIVGGAALAGLLAVRMDSREPVLVVDTAGLRRRADHRGHAQVAPTSPATGSAPSRGDQADQIVGKLYARQTIYPGQLLQTDLLRKNPPLEVDQAQVGVPLTSGKYPPGLRSGDAVRLVRIGDAQRPSQALCTGLVLEVTKAASPAASAATPRRRWPPSSCRRASPTRSSAPPAPTSSASP